MSQRLFVSRRATEQLARRLVAELGDARVLGPEQPLVERVRNQFLYTITVKIEREGVNLRAVKSFIQSAVTDILTDKGLRAVSVIIDVDCLWGSVRAVIFEKPQTASAI